MKQNLVYYKHKKIRQIGDQILYHTYTWKGNQSGGIWNSQLQSTSWLGSINLYQMFPVQFPKVVSGWWWLCLVSWEYFMFLQNLRKLQDMRTILTVRESHYWRSYLFRTYSSREHMCWTSFGFFPKFCHTCTSLFGTSLITAESQWWKQMPHAFVVITSPIT